MTAVATSLFGDVLGIRPRGGGGRRPGLWAAAAVAAAAVILLLAGGWHLPHDDRGAWTSEPVSFFGYALASALGFLEPTVAGNIGDLELDGAIAVAIFKSGGTTYAAVASYDGDGVQILDLSDPDDPNPVGSLRDTGDLLLDGAYDIATFESGGTTYAAVAAGNDNGVQIINLADPATPKPAGRIGDTGGRELDGATAVAIFKSGGTTYAAVTAYTDSGVQILRLTDSGGAILANPDPVGKINIRYYQFAQFDGIRGIDTFQSNGTTYAAVTAEADSKVHIISLADPADPTHVSMIGDTGGLLLSSPHYIDTFQSGNTTYAAVTAYSEDGVQILQLTDSDGAILANPVPAGRIADTDDLLLLGAVGITTFQSNGATYAAVTTIDENSIQIIDLSDPDNPDPAGQMGDTGDLLLDYALDVTTFESGGATYAAVTSITEDGIQIIDLSDPDSPEPAGQISDGPKLDGPQSVATFESGGATYAAVASYDDDGIQIIDLSDPDNPEGVGRVAKANTEVYKLDGPQSIATFESGGATYAAVASYEDDGIQIIDISNPKNPFFESNIIDNAGLELGGAWGIATFVSNGTTYAAVTAEKDDGVQILGLTDPDGSIPTSISEAGSIDDAAAGAGLKGARGIGIFESGGAAYAAVAASESNRVQLLRLTDSGGNVTANPVPAGHLDDSEFRALRGATGISLFESGGAAYAAVASYGDDGIQIVQLTDTGGTILPAPADRGMAAGTGIYALDGAYGIDTFGHGGAVYAAVTASEGDGVQLFRLTDPDGTIPPRPVLAGRITDTDGLELDGARGITAFASGNDTYLAVAASEDDGVQILGVGYSETVEEGADRFITKWTVREDDRSVTFPGTGSYHIDWGDGTSEEANGRIQHAYDDAGTYTVTVSGDIERFHLGDTGQNNAKHLGSIEQWGYAKWADMEGTFQFATNMACNAADSPDLSRAKSTGKMFHDASTFDCDLSGWDTSNIRNMYAMFWGAASFDSDVSGWDTSKVRSMKGMFAGAAKFNQSLSGWDTSKVRDMSLMFSGANAFDGDVSGWKTGRVTDMSAMFSGANSFDRDISEWRTGRVTSMIQMFEGAISFDQDISKWNVKKVKDMRFMFDGAASFDQDLSGWEISKGTKTKGMFRDSAVSPTPDWYN